MQRRTFITASLGGAAGLMGACRPLPGAIERRGDLYTGAALMFGTTVTVALYHADGKQAELAIEDAFHEARRIDKLMSIYDAQSQVAQLNREGVIAKPDRHLLTVLQQARALSVLTKGAFDITVQPLWQACNEAQGGMPAQSDRLKAQSKVNWARVESTADTVRLLKPGMQITLNGLAQGYAADLATAALRARGIDHALIDTGEFSARGHKPDAAWTLGVADPRGAGALVTTMRLDGRSAASSADYEASFTPDFVHHHIFDPATGCSPQELASVTVLAPSAILADGLSTACMVLGAKKSHALAARLPGVDLMTINKRGVVWKSPGFPAVA